MNLKRYIQFRVRRLVDAIEVPASLVSNRERMLDKIEANWHKWVQALEREGRALVSEFKKLQKAKKEPPKSLIAKADKLYKSIEPTCKLYKKVAEKLERGTPAPADVEKIGLKGKILPLPSNIKGELLARTINPKFIPETDFVASIVYPQRVLSNAFAPYYDLSTKMLVSTPQPKSSGSSKPQMTPKAPIVPEQQQAKGVDKDLTVQTNKATELLKNLEHQASLVKSTAKSSYRLWEYRNHDDFSSDDSSRMYDLAGDARYEASDIFSVLPGRSRMAEDDVYHKKVTSTELLNGIAKKLNISPDVAKEICTSGRNSQLFQSVLLSVDEALDWVHELYTNELL